MVRLTEIIEKYTTRALRPILSKFIVSPKFVLDMAFVEKTYRPSKGRNKGYTVALLDIATERSWRPIYKAIRLSDDKRNIHPTHFTYAATVLTDKIIRAKVKYGTKFEKPKTAFVPTRDKVADEIMKKLKVIAKAKRRSRQHDKTNSRSNKYRGTDRAFDGYKVTVIYRSPSS